MWLCSNSQWKWGVSNETLPTQSALFSWSVAHVEAVWEWWRRLHCSTSTSTWSQYHTPVIPLLLRRLQQMSLHTVTYDEQSRAEMDVKWKQTGGRKTTTFHTLFIHFSERTCLSLLYLPFFYMTKLLQVSLHKNDAPGWGVGKRTHAIS